MKKEIKAIDIDLPVDTPLESDGVAYYRLDPHFRDFLKLCNEKHGIMGFEFEEGSLNFGVILAKKIESIPDKF